MSLGGRWVVAAAVARPHGRDGSFYLDRPSDLLLAGTEVTVAGTRTPVERRAGTRERPLVRLACACDREAARALVGEELWVWLETPQLDADEWLSADLVGCEIEGLGEVTRVVSTPACELLEVGSQAIFVPFVKDAIKRIDTRRGRIEVDYDFLGLSE